jgi:hypothetical protein
MSIRNHLSCLFIALLVIIGLGPTIGRAGNCTGHEVSPVGPQDFVCNFENTFCGTSSGTISFCTGSFGVGVCTEGGGYIDIGDEDRFSSEVLEIECQVIFTQLPGQGSHAAALVTKYSNGNPAISEWGLFVEGNLTTNPSWLLTGNGTNGIYSNGGVEINTLYCVKAVLCHNGNGWIYVNGQLVAQGALTFNSSNTTTPVRIANSYSGGNYFHGMIDGVRIGVPDLRLGTESSSWGAIKSIYR